MALARRADGLLTAVSSAGRRAVGVPAITRGANREGLCARPARPQPERRFHEALAQSSRPRYAGTDAVAQWPTAVATGRTVESANEGPESQLRVLTSSQSPSTIPKIPEGYRRCRSRGRTDRAHRSLQNRTDRGFAQRPQPVILVLCLKKEKDSNPTRQIDAGSDSRAFK